MELPQVTPGQGWLQTLNNDLTNLDGNVVQRTDWQNVNAVFLNGFVGGSGYFTLKVRFLKNSREDILGTEIFGAVKKDKYDGNNTEFCTLTGVPQCGMQVVGSGKVVNTSSSIGTVNVGISNEDYTKHTLTLEIWGRRLDNYPLLDGWLLFHLIY